MILSPVENGAYGLPISPDGGFVEIMKYEKGGKLISDYLEATGTNQKKDTFQFKGQFLNIKPL